MVRQTHAGKVAVVTGGNRGLGRVMAEALAAAGARVLITGRDEAELQSTASASDGRIAALAVDVTGDGAASRIVKSAIERFGGLDILVNNAGITVELLRRQQSKEAPTVANLTAQELRQVFEVNTVAPF